MLTDLRRYLAKSFTHSILPTIHYEYSRQVPKILHWLKYVTRATWHDRNWDPPLATQLVGFRNQCSFGAWKSPLKWGDPSLPAEYAHIELLEKGICPKCGTQIKWQSKPLKNTILAALAITGTAKSIGAGYWQIDSS